MREQRMVLRLSVRNFAAKVIRLVDDPETQCGGGGVAKEAVQEDEAPVEEARARDDVGCGFESDAEVAEPRDEDTAAVKRVHRQCDVEPEKEELEEEGEATELQPEVFVDGGVVTAGNRRLATRARGQRRCRGVAAWGGYFVNWGKGQDKQHVQTGTISAPRKSHKMPCRMWLTGPASAI